MYNKNAKEIFQQPKVQILLLIITAFLLAFCRLWTGDMKDDGCCYSVLAREICRTGEWMVLHHPYHPPFANFYEHPPMYIWMMAIAFKVMGENAFAAKFFSALSGFLTIIVTYYTGKKLRNHMYGYVAAFLLLTTQYYWNYARMPLLDVPLIFWTMLGFYFIILSVKNTRLIIPFIAGIAASLGFLTKGFPALFIIIIALTAYFITFRFKKNFFIYSIIYLAGLSIILVPWTILQYIYDQGKFFDHYLFNQVFYSMQGRTSITSTQNHYSFSSLIYYLKALFTKIMVPWGILSIYGTVRLVKGHSKNSDWIRYLPLLSFLIILTSFSISLYAKARYILLVVPFLCFLAAEAIYEQPWNKKILLYLVKIEVLLLFLIITVACLTPIPFSDKFNDDLKNIQPIIDKYTLPGDTMLVAMRPGRSFYNMRMDFSWYFDRAQDIVRNEEEFFEKWSIGKYKVGIMYDNSGFKNNIYQYVYVPSFVSQNYGVFLRDDLIFPIEIPQRPTDKR